MPERSYIGSTHTRRVSAYGRSLRKTKSAETHIRVVLVKGVRRRGRSPPKKIRPSPEGSAYGVPPSPTRSKELSAKLSQPFSSDLSQAVRVLDSIMECEGVWVQRMHILAQTNKQTNKSMYKLKRKSMKHSPTTRRILLKE